MQKFRDMMEARGDTVVFTFGRLNPPTIGHGKVFDAIAKQQSKNTGSKMHIFVSHSQDAKKNPLSYNKKVAYIRKMFPKYAKNVVTSKARTIFEVAVELHDKGYKSIVMVVGSDRVAEFEKLLNEYNGVEGRHGYYGFDNIEVVSAGERDPDAEGAAGMSASKMRAAAVDGDFDSFEDGLPPKFKDGKKLYQDVRKEMGIRENRDMGKMDVYEEMRDAYLTGKIWNVGDTIKANGNTGEIVRKGTNYISYVTEDGKVHKAWLHEIKEEMIPYDVYCNLLDYIGENYHRLKDQTLAEDWWSDLSPSEQDKYISDHPNSEKAKTAREKEQGSDDKPSKEKTQQTLQDLKTHVGSVAKSVGVDAKVVAKAFKEPSVYNTVNALGGSISAASKTIIGASRTIGKVLDVGGGVISDTEAFKKLEKGVMKVDEFMDKNPKLKKVAGAAVAGIAAYQWLNMSFSGDIESDYDVSLITDGLAGKAGFADLINTPAGVKSMALLAAGLATGGLPIWMAGKAGLGMALAYTGAKKAGDHKVGKKIKKKMVEFAKKAQKKTQKKAKDIDRRLGVKTEERDYKKEYKNYHSDPKQIKRRSSRNKARRAMGDKAVKGMDVGHKDNNPLNNNPKNLRNENPSTNRREPRLREDSQTKMVKDRIQQRKNIERGEAERQAQTDQQALATARMNDAREKNRKARAKKESTVDGAIIFEMSYLMKLKAKVDQMTHPKGYEKMMKAYVKRIKGSAKRDTQGGTIKVNNPSSIASDIAREYSVSPRNFIDYINKLVGKGILPKELKAEYQMESFKDFVAQLSIHEKVRRVKQDPDIKDDPGTEPAKYYKGVAKSVKPKRDDHFERGAKMDDDNPAAYAPAPGDKGGKTKPSKHTKKFKQMYGEEPEHEIKVGNYTTKFFHMCGSAQKVMKKNANVDGAEELTRMQDRFYGFEKKIVNAGSATDDQKKKAREMYNKIMQKAKDIGLDKKISGYMKMHIDSIEKGDPKLGFGRTDLSEKLDKNSSMSDYIKDFKKSDAPQFKGKSDRKRHTMAVAAYLSRNESLLDNVNRMLKEDGHTDVASMKNKVNIAMKALQKMQSELSKLGDEDDLPTWWTNKVATAVSRIDDMSDYLDSKMDESLWANIHKKRQRIKGGSGERMRKKGEKGAPTPAQMRRAKQVRGESLDLDEKKKPTRKDALKAFLADPRNPKKQAAVQKAFPGGRATKSDKDKLRSVLKMEEAELNEWGEIEEAAEYQGRKVTLNKPFYTPDGPKKSAVYVKNEKGNVVKVTFGDPNMEIKRDDPARRKSFRARHNCDNPGPKTKARYWSCKAW